MAGERNAWRRASHHGGPTDSRCELPNAQSVQFTVTFSSDVTGVDASDFVVTSPGVVGAHVTGVTGSGTTWVVTVDTGNGDGSLRLDLVDDDTIVDLTGKQLGGVGLGNGTFSSGEVYTIDRTVPQAGSLIAPDVTSAGGTSYSFTLVLSDNLALDSTSLDGNDIRISGPGGFNQLASFIGVSPATDGTPRTATYQFTPPDGTWDSADSGTYTITVEPNEIQDTSGNAVSGGVVGTFSVRVSAPDYMVFLPMVLGEPDH